jgi:hypothetical protein
MGSYVHVAIDDLNIDDFVRKMGKVVQVSEHPTLEDYVVVVFERDGEETPAMRKSGTLVQVRVEDERYACGCSTTGDGT